MHQHLGANAILIVGENMNEKLGLNPSSINGENINGNEDFYGLSKYTSITTHTFVLYCKFIFCFLIFFVNYYKSCLCFSFCFRCSNFVIFILTFINIMFM